MSLLFSDREIGFIMGLEFAGWSNYQISDLMECHRTTISRLIKKSKIDFNFNKKTKRSPKKRKLSGRNLRNIIRNVRNGKLGSLTLMQNEIKEVSNIDISKPTIKKILNEHKIFCFSKIKKPLLSRKSRRARLNWALKHVKFGIEFWKKVLFSDETYIDLEFGDGHRKVWRKENEKSIPRATIPKIKHSRTRIMIWSCFSFLSEGLCCKIEGNVNTELYLKILKGEMIGSIKYCFTYEQRNEWLFMQDGAPAHKSKKVKQYLIDQQILLLDWVPYSPDLNPIENLWSIIKDKVKKTSNLNSSNDI
jgi:transposase